MSINISKQHREDLLDKIQQIRNYIASAPQDQNTGNLLLYLNELTKDIKGKKYGLVFEEHKEAIDEILENNVPVLKEEKNLFIDNGGQMNFLIEGDNLASLQLLEKTHKGKIDVIYIDPPYNTGMKSSDGGFMYDDKFVEPEDTFKHSKWMSFMESRLSLSKNLLRKDGLIFISIDDREQAPLKMLCDSIFGDKNCLGVIHWRKNRKPHMAGNTIAISCEYILVYFRDKSRKLIQEYAKMKTDDEGSYAIYPILKADKRIRRYTFPKGIYCEGVFDEGRTTTAKNDKCNVNIIGKPIIFNNILQNEIEVEGRFCLTDERGKLSEALKAGNIYFTKGGIPKEKRYREEYIGKIANNYWDIEGGRNEDANDELVSVFNISPDNDLFSYPKPIELIKKILICTNNKNSTILDFFAGSGTTGHAVLKLNAEDGGKRRFILCTNNENNICRDVTYERLKTVITGKRKDGSEYNEQYNASLKYYKIDFVPINEQVYYEYADELLLHIRELVELENGINFNGNSEIAIVLTDEEMEKFVEENYTAKILYRGHDVLLSAEQEQFLQSHGIRVNVIPDYYYKELNR